MPRTPTAVLMTVGHIAQSAIVKIAAGSDFWKTTRPERQPRQRRDRPQELDDRVEGLVEAAREPEQEADRRADEQREQVALADAHERVEGEPADALVHLAVLEERDRGRSGCDSFHVLHGDGRSGATVWLTTRPEHEHGGEARGHGRTQTGHEGLRAWCAS